MRWFSYLFRKAPGASDSAMLAAYERTQAPPTVSYLANGRLVQRSFSPFEGALIGVGGGQVQSAIEATSLGVNQSLMLQPLTGGPSGTSQI